MAVDPNLQRARAGLVGCGRYWRVCCWLRLVIWGVVRGAQKWPGGVLSSWLRRTTHTDMSQPTVVDRIQKLQRLETVVYTMDKIVTGEKQSEIFPDFLAGDRLLMLVHGEVIAGIDFATLKMTTFT